MKNINVNRTNAFKIAYCLGLGYALGFKFRQAQDSAFKESEHKRAKNGQFTKTGASAGLSPKQIDSAIEKVLKEIEGKSHKQLNRGSKTRSIEHDYGKEIKNPKGHNPIHTLIKSREGHIKDAYQRPDIPGLEHIDLFWGNASAGLMHIIRRRVEKDPTKESIRKVLRNLDDVIRHGKKSKGLSDDRNIVLTYNKYRAVVSLSYKGDGSKRVVVSGYSEI